MGSLFKPFSTSHITSHKYLLGMDENEEGTYEDSSDNI